MKGVDASHLRDSDTLRAKVTGQVGAISAKLETMLVDRPKRRINLVEVAAVEVEGQGAAVLGGGVTGKVPRLERGALPQIERGQDNAVTF